MKLTLLRYVVMIDAAVLLLLGVCLIFAPGPVQSAFHFNGLPAAVSYLIGLWGCVFITLGLGYVIAATDPIRHLVWAQVGIARGAMECILGGVYLARGVVTWQQAGFGIVTAAVITCAYLALYPRGDTRSRPAV